MTCEPRDNQSQCKLHQLTPRHIERRLGELIQSWLQTRSPELADSVVHHIQMLCDHPVLQGDARKRCTYLHLRAHWRWLASSESNVRRA